MKYILPIIALSVLSQTAVSSDYVWTWGWTNETPQREIEIEVKKSDIPPSGQCRWTWGWNNTSPQKEIDTDPV